MFGGFNARPSGHCFRPAILHVRSTPGFTRSRIGKFSGDLCTNVMRQVGSGLASVAFARSCFSDVLGMLRTALDFVPDSAGVGRITSVSLCSRVGVAANFTSYVCRCLAARGQASCQRSLFGRTSSFCHRGTFVLTDFSLSNVRRFVCAVADDKTRGRLEDQSFCLSVVDR